MAKLIVILLVALTVLRIEIASCLVVHGSVLCSDCGGHYDFSGIRVMVKCDRVRQQELATTDKNGAFKVNLPSDIPTSASPASLNCLAKLLGGPRQLYATRKDMVSEIVVAQADDGTHTILSPLKFSTCHGKCGLDVGSSKTIDLPVPPEYGFPPTSYYAPFLPIIGIP